MGIVVKVHIAKNKKHGFLHRVTTVLHVLSPNLSVILTVLKYVNVALGPTAVLSMLQGVMYEQMKLSMSSSLNNVWPAS